MSSLSKRDELLIVVPLERLQAANLPQGFDPNPDPILAAAFNSGVPRVMPRSAAEADPRFKQIVCYVIVRCGSQIFHYRRSRVAGEQRLAGLRSLGVGGHLNAEDVGSALDLSGLERAMRRELAEEVILPEAPSIRYLGIINDDSTEVGKVHVGLVVLAEIENPDVQLRDATLVEGRFDSPETLVSMGSEFETWSRLCLTALINLPETS